MLNLINRVSESLSDARINLRSMLLGMEFDAAHEDHNEGAQFWRELADFITTDKDKARIQRAVDQGVYETERLTAQRESLMATEPDAIDLAHDQEMDNWESLNQAVGGDLWSDPEKLATMRRIDNEMEGADWQDFHEAVVDEIQNGQPRPPTEEMGF